MKVTIVDGNRDYRTLGLDKKREYTLGRGGDCDVQIKSTLASRLHAKLYYKDGSWHIIDNQSTNGTLLNGKKINYSRIVSYDVLRIGDHLIEFNEEDLLQSLIIDGNRLGDYAGPDASASDVKGFSELQSGLEEAFKIFETEADSRSCEREVFELKNQIFAMIKDFAAKIGRFNVEMKVLFELTKSISEILNLKQLLNITLDLVNQIRKVERGLVLLYDSKSDKFVTYVTRKMSVDDLKIDEKKISGSILDLVKAEQQPILIKNSMTDERFISSESVVALSGKSILCVPLVSKRGIQGAFYLEKNVDNPFTEEDSEFMKNFASAVSVAVENTKLVISIKRERQMRNNMERFVSPNLIDQLTQTGELKLDGEKREISVIFADIKNFTAMSEKLNVEDVFSMLNQVFSGIAEIIFEYDGTLDKFIGDCVMAFFGAPVKRDDDPMRAIMVAMKTIDLARKLEEELCSKYGIKFGFSIGINTGEAIVGNVGSLDRMEYTAIGDTVNLAARLQAAAGFNEVVINESVFAQVREQVECEPLEPFFVKGKEQPVRAYVVKGMK